MRMIRLARLCRRASVALLLVAVGCGGSGGAAPPGKDAGEPDAGSSDVGPGPGTDAAPDVSDDGSDASPPPDAGGGTDATDAASCTDQCADGTSICSGVRIRHCEMQSSGCFDYSAAVSCATGRSCQGN